MELTEYSINDPIIIIEGFKKGRKGIVVEVPYDGESKECLGVVWDDNKSIGIQPVLPHVVKIRD